MPKSYPPEFRRKVLNLLAAGRSVTGDAEDLGISGACIYNWRKQDRIDRGDLPGLSTPERAELANPRRRIHSLEAELAAERPAKQLLKELLDTSDGAPGWSSPTRSSITSRFSTTEGGGIARSGCAPPSSTRR